MKKYLLRKIIAAAVLLSLVMSFTALADEGWSQDEQGRWRYMQDNGAYVGYGWKEIAGKQYYFNNDGYMLSNTITPDGYYVGADGAWVPDGQSSSQNTQNTGKNTLTASVDGTQLTFYLQEAKNSYEDDQYEVGFVSFKDSGEPLYKMYFRIDDKASGYYTEDSDDLGACYFSLMGNYNESTGKWAESYRAVNFDSKTHPQGSFELYWDQRSEKTFDGNLTVELKNESGQTVTVSKAVFQFTLGEQHEKTSAMKTVSGSGSTASTTDSASSGSSSSRRNTDYLCPRCSGSGKCPVCHGAGYTYHEYMGRSSKDNCPYCAWGTCSRCNGLGRVSY